MYLAIMPCMPANHVTMVLPVPYRTASTQHWRPVHAAYKLHDARGWGGCVALRHVAHVTHARPTLRLRPLRSIGPAAFRLGCTCGTSCRALSAQPGASHSSEETTAGPLHCLQSACSHPVALRSHCARIASQDWFCVANPTAAVTVAHSFIHA
jgi:hypothetical protein